MNYKDFPLMKYDLPSEKDVSWAEMTQIWHAQGKRASSLLTAILGKTFDISSRR